MEKIGLQQKSLKHFNVKSYYIPLKALKMK